MLNIIILHLDSVLIIILARWSSVSLAESISQATLCIAVPTTSEGGEVAHSLFLLFIQELVMVALEQSLTPRPTTGTFSNADT